jgi:hypothetical protein
MLVIREEQLEALRLSRIPALIDYVTTLLFREAPEVFADSTKDETHNFVVKGCDQAMAHGFKDAYFIGQYVLFMAWAGEDLATQPWAAEILANAGLSHLAKLVEIEDHILSQAWES